MDDTAPTEPAKERRKKKLHTIPPVPASRSWREEVGALRDVPDPLAVSLWRALRNVRMWAETEPAKRTELFALPCLGTQEAVAYACMHAPRLIEPFGTFMFLLRAPAEVRPVQVAAACRQVYEWAEARSLLLTAMHFAEAAGAVAPEDPVYANDAGWMCFRAALYDRAQGWYDRGYGLAVRMRHTSLSVSRDQSIRALLRTGILLQTLGRHEEAKRYYDRAAGRAARTGRAPLAAKANHDLMSYMAEVGTYEEAERYASQALDLYARSAPQLPALAYDYAFLLVRFHHYMYAVPLLQQCLPRLRSPGEQAMAWSLLARAAAGAQRHDLFATAESKAAPLAAAYNEFAPGSFIHLAEGARAFREWDKAESYAAMALEAARSRQQALQEKDALDLLDQVAVRCAAQPEELPANPDRIRLLTRRLGAALRKMRTPGLLEPGVHMQSSPRTPGLETHPPDPIV